MLGYVYVYVYEDDVTARYSRCVRPADVMDAVKYGSLWSFGVKWDVMVDTRCLSLRGPETGEQVSVSGRN